MAAQARVTVTWDGVEGVGPVEFAYLEEGPADGLYQVGALSLDALTLADAPAPTDRPAVIIGHDWGAIASYGAVVHGPERFQKLVAMSVPHRASLGARLFTSPAQLKRSWYMFFFQLPLAAMAVQANDFAFIDKLWRDWSPGREPPDGPVGRPGGGGERVGERPHPVPPRCRRRLRRDRHG